MFNFILKYKILKRLKKINKKEPLIVILTGAGISAESGLQTFRGINGLWNGVKIEEICRPEGFLSNPEKVLEFYNSRRKEMLTESIKYNLAHEQLSKLEKIIPETYIITQNVDNLHEQSGSNKILHIHGNISYNKCNNCNHKEYSIKDIPFPNKCSHCEMINNIRPDVVFFKESPYFMSKAEILVNSCDIFISIGTSGLVYPAAGLINNAKRNGAIIIQINPDAKLKNNRIDFYIKETATKGTKFLIDIIRSFYEK